MDLLAKNHLLYATTAPRHYSVKGEPWQLWAAGRKLTSQLPKSIYSLVHDQEANLYWSAKKDVNKESLPLIDREAIGTAMQEIPRKQRVFITKHTAGMCGVGKFMKRWGEWKEDKCPRCGEPEDAAHVWICKGEGASDIWEKAVEELQLWLRNANTDPTVTHVVIQYLTGWRLGINPVYESPACFQDAIRNQDQIGWHRLIEGWIAKDWAEIQQ
jgi:hypothetical protein